MTEKIRVTLTKSGVFDAVTEYLRTELGIVQSIENMYINDTEFDEMEIRFTHDEDQLPLDLPEKEEPAVPFS